MPEEKEGSGGYVIKYSPEEIKEEREIVKSFISKVGGAMLSGNLANVAMPVRVFEPRSFLERLTDNWRHFPALMAQAHAAKSPLERFKYVIAAGVSGLHFNVTAKKPFNPILGETYQATFNDGTQIFCEQTSHHPAVSSWEVMGPSGSYNFTGYGMWTASFSINSVKGKQNGPNMLQFADGTKIQWALPGLSLSGVMMGERVLNYQGVMTFVDLTNNLKCELVFDPDRKSWFKLSGWMKKGEKSPTDTIRGEIRKVDKVSPSDVFKVEDEDEEDKKKEDKKKEKKKEKEAEGVLLSSVDGSWLGALAFKDPDQEAKNYFDINTTPSDAPKPAAVVLPSDSRYREDLKALKEGNIDDAQEKKNAMEDLQRAEAKLRKG